MLCIEQSLKVGILLYAYVERNTITTRVEDVLREANIEVWSSLRQMLVVRYDYEFPLQLSRRWVIFSWNLTAGGFGGEPSPK